MREKMDKQMRARSPCPVGPRVAWYGEGMGTGTRRARE
jgi:hypothetical protein